MDVTFGPIVFPQRRDIRCPERTSPLPANGSVRGTGRNPTQLRCPPAGLSHPFSSPCYQDLARPHSGSSRKDGGLRNFTSHPCPGSSDSLTTIGKERVFQHHTHLVSIMVYHTPKSRYEIGRRGEVSRFLLVGESGAEMSPQAVSHLNPHLFSP